MGNPLFGRCWGRVPEWRSNKRRSSKTTKSVKAPAMDENTAAVRIQAAFRGFCVRKLRPLNKLRIIMKIKAEAAEIRGRVNDEHVVELIGRDEKERLKMTEWIMMSLLLWLDEIQGAIPFVQESRKAVIRELVNLQETVDHIIVEENGCSRTLKWLKSTFKIIWISFKKLLQN